MLINHNIYCNIKSKNAKRKKKKRSSYLLFQKKKSKSNDTYQHLADKPGSLLLSTF